MQHGNISLAKIPCSSIKYTFWWTKSHLNLNQNEPPPPWLGMNCTWRVEKIPKVWEKNKYFVFVVHPFLTFLWTFHDLFVTEIFAKKILNQLLGALGDLRIKFQLRHGQLEQMETKKTRRDGETTRSIASPWKTSMNHQNLWKLDDETNQKPRDQIQWSKELLALRCFPGEDHGINGWIEFIGTCDLEAIAPPLMRPLSHSHLKWKVPIVKLEASCWS